MRARGMGCVGMTNGDMKPIVCQKLDDVPLPICALCHETIEEGDAMYFFGTEGKWKRWVHWKCYREWARETNRERQEHDRQQVPEDKPVAAATENPQGRVPMAFDAGPRQDIVELLREINIQAFDIEAHIGSLLAAVRLAQKGLKP